MVIVCGVEEAGRGPVIGPMVMAACWTSDEELVRKAGARDSKKLTPEQREIVFERLSEMKKRKKIDFEIIILDTNEIDAAVDGAKDNLNKLELRTSAALIAAGLKRAKIAKVIIDCPTVSTEKYVAALRKELGEAANGLELVAENKADENYAIVGAASILAKVTRDREIEKLKEKIKVNFGSGYPADPFTQKFLRENYNKKEFSDLFRKSWASYKALAQQSVQKSLFSFNDDKNYNLNNSSDDNGDAIDCEKSQQHLKELKEFETLLRHGFEFTPPKNGYEVVRMKSTDATIIKYTTGKIVVQGRGKAKTEKVLKKLSLM